MEWREYTLSMDGVSTLTQGSKENTGLRNQDKDIKVGSNRTIITFWFLIILEAKAGLYRLTPILGRSGKETTGVYETTMWEK